MSKREIVAGSVDQTIDVFILDSSSTVGAGLTGLVHNTSNLVCYYRKGATGTPTALTLVTQTVGGAHADGGFVAVDGTNCPGQYRLDLSDTIVATAGMVTIYLRGAANMAPCVLEIEVVAVNKFDATRAGLLALPNANANAAGGLITNGSGTGQITLSGGKVSGVILVDTLQDHTPQSGNSYPIVSHATYGNAAIQTQTASILSDTGFAIPTALSTLGGLINGVDTVVDSIQTIVSTTGVAISSATMEAIANEVEAQIIDETDTEKVLEAITDKIAEANPDLGDLTLAAIASAVRTNLTTELGRIDVAISTRLASASYTSPPSAATIASSVRTELTTELAFIDVAISSRLATVAYTTPPTVGAIRTEIEIDGGKVDHLWETTENDGGVRRFTTNALEQAPTGSGGGSDPLDNAVPGAYAVGTAGYILGTNLNATVSSRATQASVDALPTAEQIADEVEAQIIDETDTEKVLEAITDKIAEANPDLGDLTLAAIASAVRSALAVELARIDATISSRLQGSVYVVPPTAVEIRTEIEIDGGKVDHVWETTENDGGVRRFSANALEQAPTGGGGSGEGSGANSVVITVTDGTDPLEGAKVRMKSGAESYLAVTDVDGQISVGRDNATWTVLITKPGYTFTPTTLLVDGDETVEYEMTAVTIPAQDDPALSTGYLYCYDNEGEPIEASVRCTLVSGTGSSSHSTVSFLLDYESEGLHLHPFVRGASYKAKRGPSGPEVYFTVPDEDTFEMPEILGDV